MLCTGVGTGLIAVPDKSCVLSHLTELSTARVQARDHPLTPYTTRNTVSHALTFNYEETNTLFFKILFFCFNWLMCVWEKIIFGCLAYLEMFRNRRHIRTRFNYFMPIMPVSSTPTEPTKINIFLKYVFEVLTNVSLVAWK